MNLTNEQIKTAAQSLGYTGRVGGWIKRDSDRTGKAQGWSDFCDLVRGLWKIPNHWAKEVVEAATQPPVMDRRAAMLARQAAQPWGVRYSQTWIHSASKLTGRKVTAGMAYSFTAGPRDGDFFGPGTVSGTVKKEGDDWIAWDRDWNAAQAKTRALAVQTLTGRKVGSTSKRDDNEPALGRGLTAKQQKALHKIRASAGKCWRAASPTWVFTSASETRRVMDALVARGVLVETDGVYHEPGQDPEAVRQTDDDCDDALQDLVDHLAYGGDESNDEIREQVQRSVTANDFEALAQGIEGGDLVELRRLFRVCRDEPIYQRWLEALDDGTAFRNHSASHASRGGWAAKFKVHDAKTGRLMEDLGRLCWFLREYMPICLAVIRGLNPHAATREWEAKMFDLAWAEIEKGYTDVEKLASPEPGRRSDAQRPYTRWEKFVILCTLSRHTDSGSSHKGWCAQRFIAESSRPTPNQWDRPLRHV